VGVKCGHHAQGDGSAACQLRRSMNAGVARADGVRLTCNVSTTAK
jgi:hypothetical protein